MSEDTLARIAGEIAEAEPDSDLPRYRQIIDGLTGAIERGDLGPGDRLPAELDLAKLFSVSLGTIQKSLTHLADGGLVERTRRRGTFVSGRQAEDVFVFRFRDPATGGILIPFTRVLAVTEDASEGPWRDALSTKRCVRVDRLVWVEGDSPAFSQFHIALEHGRHLLKAPIDTLHGVSFHRVLGREFNLPTLRTSHALQSGALSDEACRHLVVPKGSFGTHWTATGFSYQQATTFQSLQIPAGHRPIEFEVGGVATGRSALPVPAGKAPIKPNRKNR